MRRNYKKLDEKWTKRGQLSPNDRYQLPIYFFTWLGFLGVTAEGFKKLAIRRLLQNDRPPEFFELIPRADEIGKLIKKNDDALRKVRNSVFHLRDSTEEIERFFHERPGRLRWAEDLQANLEQFFSNYRVLCQFHYLNEGRKDELFKTSSD